ncbi:MAG: ATP-dependent zinc protease [Zetaproteobacteria bacterium]|nr:ATP-dependent zinc protease [Zetaproteobacteria bacterium]
MNKVMLGWREWVALPDLGIQAIKAKIDSGARSSALHTFDLERFSEDGVQKVRFAIHPFQHDNIRVKYCIANLIDERNVTDSGGHTELRPVISTTLFLGGIHRTIEMTLCNRETMKFRMLLGRTAMHGQFTIDPEHAYLLGKPQIISQK